MSNPDTTSSDRQTVSDRLNQNCFCVTLDRPSLCEALESDAGDPAFCETFSRTCQLQCVEQTLAMKGQGGSPGDDFVLTMGFDKVVMSQPGSNAPSS